MQQFCNCNELCFYYQFIKSKAEGDITYLEKYNINKCNRLFNENTRKKPCDYYSKVLIERKKYIKNEYPEEISPKKNNEIITIGDIRFKIDNLLKFYDINTTNYFGRLNIYLKKIGYGIHDPTNETISELRIRLSKPPNNKYFIYINEKSYLSETLGEYNFDYEKELQFKINIENKLDLLEWTKNEKIQEILKIDTIKKLPKKKNTIKNSLKKKNSKINSDLEEYIEKEKNQNEEKEKYLDEDEEKNLDEDEDQGEEENLDDNIFDVDENSDDEFDDDNYNEFSD